MKKQLIIGRGIAGSVLSLQMLQRNIAHDIIDAPALSSSSKIAAGLINPIVLKRLKLVTDAVKYMASANTFYKKWENQLKTSFYTQLPILNILSGPGEHNLWQEKKDNSQYSIFLDDIIPNVISTINAPHGYGQMNETAWLNTPVFLEAHRQYFITSGSLTESSPNNSELLKLAGEYENVILCTGHLMKNMDDSLKDIFTPSRGEIMIIQTEELPPDAIYHGAVFILPLGKNLFKVGATYHWDILQDISTEAGLSRLTSDLNKIFSGSYTIIEHLGGVRPNIKDRKPLLGRLQNNIHCFNGMGSRGVLMAPYLSEIFLDFLIQGKPLPIESNIQRFLE